MNNNNNNSGSGGADSLLDAAARSLIFQCETHKGAPEEISKLLGSCQKPILVRMVAQKRIRAADNPNVAELTALLYNSFVSGMQTGQQAAVSARQQTLAPAPISAGRPPLSYSYNRNLASSNNNNYSSPAAPPPPRASPISSALPPHALPPRALAPRASPAPIPIPIHIHDDDDDDEYYEDNASHHSSSGLSAVFSSSRIAAAAAAVSAPHQQQQYHHQQQQPSSSFGLKKEKTFVQQQQPVHHDLDADDDNDDEHQDAFSAANSTFSRMRTQQQQQEQDRLPKPNVAASMTSSSSRVSQRDLYGLCHVFLTPANRSCKNSASTFDPPVCTQHKKMIQAGSKLDVRDQRF